jgi:hypothetical protein
MNSLYLPQVTPWPAFAALASGPRRRRRRPSTDPAAPVTASAAQGQGRGGDAAAPRGGPGRAAVEAAGEGCRTRAGGTVARPLAPVQRRRLRWSD